MTPEQLDLFQDLATAHIVQDIVKSARHDLIRSAARRMYRSQIEAGTVTAPDLKYALEYIGAEHFKAETRGRKSLSKLKFITISAQDNIDVHKFWLQMKKCIKKSSLLSKRGSYVIEQRSEDDQEPYGWHIHWLVEFESTSSTAVISQQVYQCFSKYLGGSNYVDVKDVYDDEQWQQKFTYINGTKQESKMGKVRKDEILRNKLNLPPIISY